MSINYYGKKLLYLSLDTKLRSRNGRMRGDLQLYITYRVIYNIYSRNIWILYLEKDLIHYLPVLHWSNLSGSPILVKYFTQKKKELASVKQDERQLKHSRKKTPKTEYTQRLCEEKTKVVGPFFEKDNDNSSGIGNILGKTHKKKKPKNESS